MVTATNNTKTYTLNNGLKIPAVGFGCMTLSTEAIGEALKVGYRHLDTASIYGKGENEVNVGKAIKASGIPREELFVVSKVWNTEHKSVAQSLDDSLQRLGLDYVDCFLMHFPYSDAGDGSHYKDWDFVDTYREMNKILNTTKKVRSIGVSNFFIEDFEKLKADPEIDAIPVINQIEAHPLLTQPELKDYMDKEKILLQAYCPLGGSGAFIVENEDIKELAKKNDVTPGQVLLSWAVQRGSNVIPRTQNYDRIAENFKTFTLDDKDFEAVNTLADRHGKKRVNPVWRKELGTKAIV